MKTKKIILIITCIVLVFALIKAKKIKRYFVEQRYYSILVMLDLAKPCFDPYKKREDIFIQEGFDYTKYNNKIVINSLRKISDTSEPIGNLKIPNITHQIYFTPPSRTEIIKDFYIEKMKITYTKLNTFSDWNHYIWTNNEAIFPDELKQIKGVQFRKIDEFKDHPLYNNLVNAIDKGKDLVAYFAESSDLFRLLVLQKLGGVYYDMDYEIYNGTLLFKYMKKFDFIGGRETVNSDSLYGNSFLAAKPNHPVINEAVTRMIRNYKQDKNAPKYIQYPCTENDRLYFNGPPLITLAYFAKNNIQGNNDVILPGWMILNIGFARFKNQTCDYAKITKDDFIKHDEQLSQLINDFTTNFNQKYIDKAYKITNSNGSLPNEDNIYYDFKYRKEYEIIGADMGCGTWVTERNPRYFYWK